MKIVQVHNFYQIRAGECGVVKAEKALLEEYGHLVLPYYRDSAEINDYGLAAKANTLFRMPFSKAVEKDLMLFLDRERPDVAHVHNVFPLLTPAVYRALQHIGVPVVQTVHNFRFLCPNGQFYSDDKICEACQDEGFLVAVKNRCVRNSALVSGAYSAAISRSWRQGIIPDCISAYITLNEFFSERLVHAGIPCSRIHLLRNFVSAKTKDVQAKGDYILYLGRLSREKGIHTLLQAWERIGSGVLKIAGSGPLENEVRGYSLQKGGQCIEMLGYVAGDAKRALIEGATAMVVPSEWYENCPISVLEAMSCGTPVIASDIGGIPELVKHGETGLIFEPGNVVALENAIRNLMSDRDYALTLAGNALSVAHKELGPDRHYNGLMEIYSRTISHKTRCGLYGNE